MSKITIGVEGMSCEHCVMTVKKAVSAIDGISDVAVSLDDKAVTFSYIGDGCVNAAKDAIVEAGYEVA